MRQPLPGSPVYKITIISVNPHSVLCGERPDKAGRLLGRKIAREPNQIMKDLEGMMQKLYKDQNWIVVNKKDLNKIEMIVRRKKNELRPSTSNRPK